MAHRAWPRLARAIRARRSPRVHPFVAGVLETLPRRGPILAGPWRGEVGDELLQWIPFLRYLVRIQPGLGERLVVVSRGGVADWYEGVARDYIDIFDLMSPEEYAAGPWGAEVVGREREYVGVKRRRFTAVDVELLRRARAQIGDNRAGVLSSVFSASLPTHCSDAKARRGDGWLVYSRITCTRGRMLLPPDLPDSYVAVGFYRNSFLNASAAGMVTEIVRALLQRSPVVVIESGGTIDDHRPHPIGFDDPALHRIGGAIDPALNLARQTAALERATAFVGTLGGLAFLPPLMGIPTTGVFSNPRKHETGNHATYLRLASRAAVDVGAAFTTVDAGLVSAAEIARQVVGQSRSTPERSG